MAYWTLVEARTNIDYFFCWIKLRIEPQFAQPDGEHEYSRSKRMAHALKATWSLHWLNNKTSLRPSAERLKHLKETKMRCRNKLARLKISRPTSALNLGISVSESPTLFATRTTGLYYITNYKSIPSQKLGFFNGRWKKELSYKIWNFTFSTSNVEAQMTHILATHKKGHSCNTYWV